MTLFLLQVLVQTLPVVLVTPLLEVHVQDALPLILKGFFAQDRLVTLLDHVHVV